jgi:hypothetical protein
MNAPKRPGRQRPELYWWYRLRITLLDVKPTVWREVMVPETITLPKLHMVFQHAMGWTNSHLHEFVIRGRHYTDYLEDDWEPEKLIDERRVRLQAALGRVVRTFDYLYDFGDGWHHAVVVEDREPNPVGTVARVRCIAGERACPPEDVGGVSGYADFLDAIDDPRHPEHEQNLTWCGGSFDPDRFDVEGVNERLGRMKV